MKRLQESPLILTLLYSYGFIFFGKKSKWLGMKFNVKKLI